LPSKTGSFNQRGAAAPDDGGQREVLRTALSPSLRVPRPRPAAPMSAPRESSSSTGRRFPRRRPTHNGRTIRPSSFLEGRHARPGAAGHARTLSFPCGRRRPFASLGETKKTNRLSEGPWAPRPHSSGIPPVQTATSTRTKSCCLPEERHPLLPCEDNVDFGQSQAPHLLRSQAHAAGRAFRDGPP